MKKLTLLLLFVLAAGCSTFAQSQASPAGKTKHMLITIVNDNVAFTIGHKAFNMFVTRDDSTQVQTYLDFNLHVKNKDAFAAHEQQIMDVLSVYYAQGWKLVTTSVETTAETIQTEVYRYFLVKNE